VGERERLTDFAASVQSIDSNLPYRYPSRTLKITTPAGSFETPARAATFYEYRSRMQITAKATIESPVAINVRKMNSSQLGDFVNKNQFFEPLLRKIEMYNHVAQYSLLKLSLIQPTTTSNPEDMRLPAMEVLQNDAGLRDRFLRFIVRLQSEAGMNPITIPFLELPFDTLKSVVVDLHRSVTSMDLAPVFFVDLRYPEFQNLISLLTEDLQSQLIGLIYRRFSLAPVNYDFLSRTYSDRDVAFLCAHVDRYDLRYDDLATPHYLPFFGTDIYAVEAPSQFQPEQDFEHPPDAAGTQYAAAQEELPRIDKIRFFDRRNLKVKPIHSTFFENILGDMNDEDRNYLGKMLANSDEANSDQKKYRALHSLSRFHELRSSTNEFQNVRKYIGEGSARVYVQAKTSLEPALAEIRK
jgi:hypothetical protein